MLRAHCVYMRLLCWLQKALAEEVWKSNFRQYGQMAKQRWEELEKIREEKRREEIRREEKRRSKKQENQRREEKKQENQRREEKRRSKKIREEKRRSKKIREEKESEERRYKRAKKQKSREPLCFANVLGLQRVEKYRKVGSLKRRVRSRLGR